MSVSQSEEGVAVLPDFSSMTEEEQIAYAMQMSLAGGGELSLIIKMLVLSQQQKRLICVCCEQSTVKWSLLPWTLQNQSRLVLPQIILTNCNVTQ